MSSYLDKKSGIFDPLKQYAFTNITNEPFIFRWNNIPTTVEAGETIELPEYLALHATRNLVDQIMQGESLAVTRKKQETNPDYRAPSVAGNLGVPAARKVYEDKILKELSDDRSTDKTLGIKRQQIKDQLLKDLSTEPSPLGSAPTATAEDFIDIKKA